MSGPASSRTARTRATSSPTPTFTFRRKAADDQLDGQFLAYFAAEQLVDRHTCGLASDIPQRHVDGGLGERVADEHTAEATHEGVDIAWVLTDELGRKQVANDRKPAGSRLARPCG
jgi:hypothetical protein